MNNKIFLPKFFSVHLSANYIDIKCDKNKTIMQYLVKFSPDVDSRSLRHKLLRQHTNALGNTINFDGALLFLPTKLLR